MKIPSIFRRRKPAPEAKHQAISNLALAHRTFEYGWDWGAEDNAYRVFRSAWLGEHEPDPEHFVPFFKELTPLIDRAFAHEKKSVAEHAGRIAVKIFDEYLDVILATERAVGIMIVFDANPVEHEQLMDRLENVQIDPGFAFRSALALAKLRDPERVHPLMSREELQRWKQKLIRGVGRFDRASIAASLNIIGAVLRRLEPPEFHRVFA